MLTRCFWPPESEMPCNGIMLISHQASARTNETLPHPFADLGHVAVRQYVKVGLQARVMHGLPITCSLKRPTEANIVADCGILHVSSAH